MNDSKKWWENRVIRSVDNLKLWAENPRIDPAVRLVTIRDYAEEFISDPIDEQNFLKLVRSIAERGFMPFDPIVVWQEEVKKHFIVAEGNRRVLALKLLRSPERAPISIRKAVVNLSRMIDRDEIEKVKVCLAPTYEDARWYILQRHSSAASEQIKWQRLQQQRFIINVYDSVSQSIEETVRITGFKRATIVDSLRYVKIRDIATLPEVTKFLNSEEKEQVFSHKISMTVLERWFGNSQVRERWHISFNDDGVTITAEPSSFYFAYAKFLKAMLTKDTDLGFFINTRSIDNKFGEIFDFLPAVSAPGDTSEAAIKVNAENQESPQQAPDKSQKNQDTIKNPKRLKGNPNRRQLTDKFHGITTTNYKISKLFDELRILPVFKYPNMAAASIRIFLELAIDEYIVGNGLKDEMTKRFKKGYHEVSLSLKLDFLKGEFIDDRDANKVIDELRTHKNDFSLNTLNEYIHGSRIHKVEPQFLNRFWDMMSPLFSVLINLKEV